MKKFMVSITIVMAMIVAMFGIGSEKAFASTFNEERIAHTQAEQVDEEMILFEEFFADYVKSFDACIVIEQNHRVYETFVVWSYVATNGVESEADSTIFTIEEVHDLAYHVKAYKEVERLSDWM